MSQSTVLTGISLSPYVRKVSCALRLKGMDYQHIPMAPTAESKTPEFLAKSPLGKIPLLEHDGLAIPDSSVICQYLDQLNPTPALYPSAAADRARALWLEEYADTRLAQVFAGGIFFEQVVKPKFFGQETDAAVVKDALENGVPEVCSYLEKTVPENDFLFGTSLSLADIAIASQYLNATYAKFQIDADRWPKAAAYLQRVIATPVMQQALADDQAVFQRAA